MRNWTNSGTEKWPHPWLSFPYESLLTFWADFTSLHRLEGQRNRSPGVEAFLEELIVRRELSMNLLFYNETYDSYEVIPHWAKQTLRSHQRDKRPYLYRLQELEKAETHDPYWNAAKRRCSWRAKCTVTCECTGERNHWMEQKRLKRPFETLFTSITNMNWMEETPTALPVWLVFWKTRSSLGREADFGNVRLWMIRV